MTIVYTQNFDALSPPALPPNWTAPSGKGTWLTTTAHPISSQNALINTPAVDGSEIVCTAFTAIADMDIRYDFTSEETMLGVLLRSDSNAENCYALVTQNTNGTVYDVYKIISGSASHLGSINTGYSSGTGGGQQISVRARIKGSTIQIKIWPYGTTEPAYSSGSSLTDTSITAAGYFGFYANVVTSGGNTVDNIVVDDTTVGALVAGTSSSSSVGTTSATITNTGATGGTSPYTYQWYRSTTSGFTPGSGNIVSGATSLTLNDTGLSPSTTYYYVNVVTDSASATANSAQISLPTQAAAALANGTLSSGSLGSTTVTVIDSGATGGTSPYAYQWYRSTISGFTPGSGNIVSGATSLTLNDTGLTPSTNYYYKSIVTDHVSATAISSQLSVSTIAGLGSISVANSGLFWSKANWDHLTVGTFGASVDTMQTTAPGAFVRGVFANTTTLNLLIDNSTTSGFPSGDMPFVRYSVNDGPYVDVQLAPGQTSIAIGSGWSTGGSYNVEVYLNSLSNTTGYSDIWGSGGVRPPNNLSITGFTGDSGITVSLPAVLGGNMLVYSDSIGAGEHAWYAGSGADDATSSWVMGYSRAMNCEAAAVCYGGQGMTVPGGSNMPALPTTFASYSSGRARSFAGITAIAVAQCGNDLRNGVSAGVTMTALAAFLPNLRAAVSPTIPIYIIVECMGAFASNIASTVAAYKNSSGDNYTYFVDPTPLLPAGVFTVTFGGVGRYTYDQVHPITAGHALIAPANAKATQAAITTPKPITPSHQLKRARS